MIWTIKDWHTAERRWWEEEEEKELDAYRDRRLNKMRLKAKEWTGDGEKRVTGGGK